MFSKFHSMGESSQLYKLGYMESADYLEITKFQLNTGRLLVVFKNDFLKVMEALEVRLLEIPNTKVF